MSNTDFSVVVYRKSQDRTGDAITFDEVERIRDLADTSFYLAEALIGALVDKVEDYSRPRG